jgi:peptide/nickel transport system substrate-binding protein
MKTLNYRAVSKMVVVAIVIVLVIVSTIAVYYLLILPSTRLPEKTVVTYASLSEMVTLDPSTESSNSIMVLCLVYEPLVWYDPLENRWIPALATSWKSEENDTIWIFYLRKGVTFHDGTSFNATAVKYSIERTISLGATYYWECVDNITVIDDYTIKFKLKYPAPLNIVAGASYFAWIFSPNTPNTPEWFNAGNDCGSGPYKIVKWDPEAEVILEKYEDWWGWKESDYPMASAKAPDMFVVKIVKDAVTQETLVKAGDIDIAQFVPVEDVEILNSDPKLQVVFSQAFQQCLVMFNTRKFPLSNPLIRKAIAHAINYEDVIEVARAGLAEIASGPVPHGMPGHFEDLKYEYNLTKARELLTEAGYPNGGFQLLLTYTAGDIHEKKTAEVIKANLAELGISLEIRAMSWEEQWGLGSAGWENPDAAQDMFLFYMWPGIITPKEFFWWSFYTNATMNFAYYSNPEFEAMVDEANRLEGYNYSRALQLYHEAQMMLYNDVPAIPLWDLTDFRVAVKRVGNLERAINPAYQTVVFAQVLSVEK